VAADQVVQDTGNQVIGYESSLTPEDEETRPLRVSDTQQPQTDAEIQRPLDDPQIDSRSKMTSKKSNMAVQPQHARISNTKKTSDNISEPAPLVTSSALAQFASAAEEEEEIESIVEASPHIESTKTSRRDRPSKPKVSAKAELSKTAKNGTVEAVSVPKGWIEKQSKGVAEQPATNRNPVGSDESQGSKACNLNTRTTRRGAAAAAKEANVARGKSKGPSAAEAKRSSRTTQKSLVEQEDQSEENRIEPEDEEEEVTYDPAGPANETKSTQEDDDGEQIEPVEEGEQDLQAQEDHQAGQAGQAEEGTQTPDGMASEQVEPPTQDDEAIDDLVMEAQVGVPMQLPAASQQLPTKSNNATSRSSKTCTSRP